MKTTGGYARRARGAFTMLEMVVVLVMMGILLAFIYPKLSGNDTLARDQKAQTSASAALDAVSAVLNSIGAGASVPVPREAGRFNGATWVSDCTAPPPVTSPAGLRPLSARENPALGANPAAYPVQVPTADPGTYATNCPLFANPTALQAATGDVVFVGGSTAAYAVVGGLVNPTRDPARMLVETPASVAAAPSTVSVAAVNTGLAWRVGVAVRAPLGGSGLTKTAISTCWMAWREYPLAGADKASARERYFYTTILPPVADAGTAPDITNCTGARALTRGIPPAGVPGDFTALPDYTCEMPASGKAADLRGLSWRAPCGDYGLAP